MQTVFRLWFRAIFRAIGLAAIIGVAPGQTAQLINLHSFDGTNGAYPLAGLTLGPNGNFYGVAYGGGISNAGLIYRISSSGTFAVVTNFTGANGAYPQAAMTFAPDGNFYGTTFYGGSNN